MTSPLIAKPFLQNTAAVADDDDDGDVWNSSQVAGHCIKTRNSSTAAPRDYTIAAAESHYAPVKHVFVIVAVYSLVVGLIMLAIFINDYRRLRRHSHLNAGVMQMSTEETEVDDRLDATLDNSAHSPSRDCDVTTTAQTVVTFRVKIALLFFAFNFFYGGIEVGYAGLVLTYVVTYFGWTKNDGTTLVFLLQASNALVTALSVGLSRYVLPQVIL